ncbi:MAG: class I SAM-dependent methyltransferase [Lachnospiraceae bacterium]|nr:class I SAM-dependent methyltransferase [Lachnospiraceae bacterium]
MNQHSSYQITDICHYLMEQQVKAGDICIDATAGNGNDTEYLCQLAGQEGKVYAFDIQEEALRHTKERLDKKGWQAELILDSHDRMADYVKECGKISCIVFNFGYLPGGSHDLATRPESSVRAIEEGLKLLKKDGALCLCIYSGKDSGFAEREAILSRLKNLDSKRYLVVTMEYYNRPNHPPLPVLVKKLY